MTFIRLALTLSASALLAPALRAQDEKKPDWDVTQPFGPTTPLTFTTDEGTWMSVDVHPSGSPLIFDLLGDLYTLPIAGGCATRVTEGGGYDFQPRFSPDGKKILFTSDRGGPFTIWTAGFADGAVKDPKALTEDKVHEMDGAEWDPSGSWIYARRRTTDTSSIGVSEIWMFHVDGGAGLALTDKKSDGEIDFPCPTKDGRYLYFGAMPGFRYDANPYGTIWSIKRLDRRGGQTDVVNGGLGSSAAPMLSPDGTVIAFIRRENARTTLWLHDIATGGERRIGSGMDRDQIEGFAAHGAYPRYAWTPDGRFLVFWAKGKLWKLDPSKSGAEPSAIPFTAEVNQPLHDAVRFQQNLAPDRVDAKVVRWPVFSPKDPLLVFSALGHLYKVALPDGAPVRLTTYDAFEFSPSFSPDGKWIVFSTWDDDAGATVQKLDVATGALTPLHGSRAQIVNPAFSPDGSTIAFVQGGGANLRGMSFGSESRLDLYTIDAAGRGKPSFVASTPSRGPLVRMTRVTFSAAGDRLFYVEDEENPETTRGLRTPPKTVLCSVKLDGGDRRVHIRIDIAQEIVPNPAATHVAFTRLHNAYVCPFPMTGATVDIATSDAAVPFKQFSFDGGEWVNWAGSSTVTWGFGPEVFRTTLDKIKLQPKADERPKPDAVKLGVVITEKDEYILAGRTLTLAALQDALATEVKKTPAPDIEVTLHDKSSQGAWRALEKWLTERKATFSIVADKEEKKEEEASTVPPEKFGIRLSLPRAKPKGAIAFTGARIVTMRGKEVIENGTIVIEDDRIAAVGTKDTVAVPAGAKVIDAAGKTIIPGLVDVHAHMHYDSLDVTPRREWNYHAILAYGVTTTHDPSASTHTVFGQAELVAAGLMTGPRIYSTGFVLYGALSIDTAPIDSYEDALSHVRRLKKLGAISVKSYMQPRRDQRQWVLKACREEGLLAIPEGGGDFELNMSMIFDGHTGIEHALVVAPIYNDVITLFARSKCGYTPTLLVAYGGNYGHKWFAQHDDVWKNRKLQSFYPPRSLEAEFRRREMAADDDYNYRKVAEGCRQIDAAGGLVNLGAHGQLQGLGAHWELWALTHGGMSAHDALKAATINGAKYLGMDRQIGSIEPGKLADLAILEKNPLEKIENSDSVAWTMINGYLYESATMNRVWPDAKPRGRFCFENEK